MAIKKFSQQQSTNITPFYNWLTANKAGTFLNDVGVSIGSNYATNDLVTISDQTNGQSIQYEASSNLPTTKVIEYYDGTTTWTWFTPTYGSSSAYLEEAILCNYGLIVKFHGTYSSGSAGVADYYLTCLTVDENGKLTFIGGGGRITHARSVANDCGFSIYSPSMLQQSTYNIYPTYGQGKTILTPLTMKKPSGSILLPYAYAATQTELASEGLCGVTMNNEDYITNGTFYVKD